MLRYAVTIFLGAFLLFQVQPISGKVILPWFGGGASVWTTCMLFFQVGLLGGYLYAHCLTRLTRPVVQGSVHAILLAGSLLALPNPAAWKPEPGAEPIRGILLLLTANIGVPFVLLSATGPLLQAWFARTMPGRSPYRLYALSNVASLAALVTYPVLVETTLGTGTQLTVWSMSYALFAIFCGYCALVAARSGHVTDIAIVPTFVSQSPLTPALSTTTSNVAGRGGPETAFHSPSPAADGAQSLSLGTVLLWLGLSACGSAMLLATTNQLCQEVAVVPFLWIVPLVLYLLSFVICFDSPRWYDRAAWGVLLANMAPWAVIALFVGADMPLTVQLLIFPLTLFACCMTCHGELVKAKPAAGHLTLFYLMIATGGALGGLAVALIAPHVFPTYWEYHVALAACCLLTLVAWYRDGFTPLAGWAPRRVVWMSLLAGQAALIGGLIWHAIYTHGNQNTLLATRNFYGALRVEEVDDGAVPPEPMLRLVHGQITHGYQYREGDRLRATSYYSPLSGVALAVRLCRAEGPEGLRIGVVGLGAGTIAAHGRAGDVVRFYEINPQVAALSYERYFTFYEDSPAEVEIVLGDARICMEQELRRGQPQQYDLLAVDAFSSDSIPIHLLTKECAEVYWQHLRPDGVLALHISNRFLSLGPVTRGLAELRPGCRALQVGNEDDKGASGANWVLLTSNSRLLAAEEIAGNAAKGIRSRVTPWPREEKPVLWTDDFHSLWKVIRWTW